MIRLLKAIVRAERFIQERPDEAKAILRTSLQLDQPFIEWVWGGMAYRLSLDQSLISTMEGEARWARREGHVKGASPNFLGLLHSAPLKAVKPSAVGVNR
jgi:ABC-type nitrate/sulfonate/bicarbonate transport system substrate-binding protein